MSKFKRKKVERQRGSKTHGWGSKKKHRGAGNRGGTGMAGTGKRAGHKKQLILKIYGTSYFGKRGFVSRFKKIIKAVNINYLEKLYSQEKLKEQNGIVNVNLKDLGYNKLLALGNPTRKYKITTEFFSKNAKEKIEKAGGTIVILQKSSS